MQTIKTQKVSLMIGSPLLDAILKEAGYFKNGEIAKQILISKNKDKIYLRSEYKGKLYQDDIERDDYANSGFDGLIGSAAKYVLSIPDKFTTWSCAYAIRKNTTSKDIVIEFAITFYDSDEIEIDTSLQYPYSDQYIS